MADIKITGKLIATPRAATKIYSLKARPNEKAVRWPGSSA